MNTHANSFCERVIGTIRRECLDFMIPMSERHVRGILRAWVRHYNRGGPHARLGPRIPDGSMIAAVVSESNGRSVPGGCRVAATPILSGLHHVLSDRRVSHARLQFLRITGFNIGSAVVQFVFVLRHFDRLSNPASILDGRK